MLIQRYIDKLSRAADENGALFAASESVRLPYKKSLQLGNGLRSGRENIFEFEWELLIIVDACRFDLMGEILNERDTSYVDKINSIRSVESATAPWMQKTFTSEYESEMEDTIYVCGNPYSHKKLEDSDFDLLDEVWTYAWDESLGTLPARPVTDRAIELSRSHNPSRLIVHYMQPHCPFIDHMDISRRKGPDEFGGGYSGPDVWQRLKMGEVTKEEVWAGYRDNLRYVMDEIEILIKNVPVDGAVLTSDHGNSFGEWGVYGHPWRMPLSCLLNVPWITLSTKDTGEYQPEVEVESESSVDIEDRLKALGYR
jgi:hypothetical protein